MAYKEGQSDVVKPMINNQINLAKNHPAKVVLEEIEKLENGLK